MVRTGICSVVLCTLVLQLTWASHQYRLDLLVQNAEDEKEVDSVFARTRSLLSPDEKQLLEEILAADEVIMEREQRGIVDQILATISGVGSGFGILGGGPGRPLVGVAPTTTTTTTKSPTVAKADLNVTSTAAPAVKATAAPAMTQTQAMNNENHLFNQISSVIVNSNRRNVSGIVDAALSIGTPAPVRDLVNGILGVAYCNGIRRLLGRC